MSDLFRQALESANIGVLVFGGRGTLRYLNPAAEEILQGSERALANKSYRTIFRGAPAAARIVRRVLSERAAVTAYDIDLAPVRRIRSVSEGSPEPYPVILGASPLTDPEKDPGGAVLTIKPAEILSLVGQEERAAMSAEELQTLSYGIAHEIKNPLGGILGAAQWLLREDPPAEERREGTRLILREAERINGLVEKMLEVGRTPPPPRPVPLLPLLREAEQLLRADLRGRHRSIRIDLEADPSLPPVAGHADTIFRAVVNLLKNAAEAIPGEGTIRIRTRLNVNYRWGRGRGRRRSFVEVSVSDTGVGMTEEEARRALLPFHTTKPTGTGLGLVMVRQAVSRHGGKLEIKSTRGKGTTVTISLPVDTGRNAVP
ncbi:MAG: nitrogen fixation sensor histidine kinase GnfL [Deltaproteobacteria bacterium]